VGGGILVHGWHAASSGIEQLSTAVGTLMQPVASLALTTLAGVLAGAVTLLVVTLVQHLRARVF